MRRKTFVVAGAQMLARRSIPAAATAIERMIRRAAARGASHLVTPEMVLTGYHDRFDQARRDAAIDGVLRPACKRHGITLMLGAGNFRDRAGRRMPKPYIQVTIIGPDGEIVGVHNKTIPTTGDLKWCTRGQPRALRVYSAGGLTFGCTICNDFWATPGCTSLRDINLPVLLAEMGAKVIFHSIASSHNPAYLDFHTRRMEERAIRGGAWVVSANLVDRPTRRVNAPSGIVGPDGVWRVKAPAKGEHLYVGKIRI